MKSLSAKAAKANRTLLKQLYEKHCRHAYYLAFQLCRHEDKAVAAASAAFAKVLERNVLAAFSDEKAFLCALEQAVADSCRAQLSSKALRLPQDRRFDLRDCPATVGENDTETVFAAFSDLQRWVFVLHTCTAQDEQAICRMTKLDPRTLQDAVEAEQRNIEKLLPSTSYEDFVKSFESQEASTTVPTALNEAVRPSLTPVLSEKEKKDKTRKQWTAIITATVCAVVVVLTGIVAWDIVKNSGSAGGDTTTTTTQPTTPEMATVGTVTTVNATHYADIDVKDHGVITVALDATIAPETVFNFHTLADQGFYDGLTFHRIMAGFMMQGGDPLGNGTGGSDRNITGEFATNGVENPLSHVRGAISMARSNDPNSASSQFFIVHEDSTFLDGQYAAFGYVTEGMEIVDTICAAAEPTDDNGTIPSAQQPIINTIKVRTAE